MVLTAVPGAAQNEPDQVLVAAEAVSAVLDGNWQYPEDGCSPEKEQEHPSLLGDVARDYGRFFTTRATYVNLGLGLGASLAAKPFDEDIADSGSNANLPVARLLGSALVQVGGAFATYGVGSLTGKPGVAALGRDLVRAQLLTQGVTQLLKYSVRRTCPDGSSRTSFPSGHASGTFTSATVLQRHYGWKVGIPAFGVASYVAASRIAEKKHFLSDVIFGAAIGIAGGRTSCAL